MSHGDYGYFGTGTTGYTQYKKAFDRNFGGPGKEPGGGGNGGGCGCLLSVAAVCLLIWLLS